MFHQDGDSDSFHDEHSLPLDGALPASLYEAADFLLREAAPLIKDDSTLDEQPCGSCLGPHCVCSAAALSQIPSTSSSSSSSCTLCQGATNMPVLRLAHEIVCLSMAFCHRCCITFNSKLAAELHAVREHSALPCMECDESFTSELKLASHLVNEHSTVRCPCCDQMVGF
jgi:hypothetical protein